MGQVTRILVGHRQVQSPELAPQRFLGKNLCHIPDTFTEGSCPPCPFGIVVRADGRIPSWQLRSRRHC